MDHECGLCEGTGLVDAGQWPCPECRGKGVFFGRPRFCLASDDEDDPNSYCDYPNCYCS